MLNCVLWQHHTEREKMNYFFILVVVLLFSTQTICFKAFNRNFMKNAASYFIYNFLYFTLVVVIFLIGRPAPSFSLPSILWGTLFGTVFVTTFFIYMKAMEIGQLSFTTLFFSFGLLIPVIFGVLLWNERISATQIIGLILLLVTFYLGSITTQPEGHKASLRWMLFCFIAFLGNGGLMTLIKAHQVIMPGREMREFLIIAFCTAALLSVLLFFIYSFAKHQSINHMKRMSLVIFVLVAGGTTAFGNQLTLYLAGRVPAVIQFPMVNGGVVILSTIASCLLFREKLYRKSTASLAIGVIALVLLSIS